MSVGRAGAVALMCAVAAGCAGRSAGPNPASPPALLLGTFTDDYGSRFTITAREWRQGSQARYHIVRWDPHGQFVIAQNDAHNPSDQGLWTRIDWLELSGMAPFRWGFCYSAFKAPSAAVAETVSVANRAIPRTGCNGYPFSRMRPIGPDSVGSGASYPGQAAERARK